MRFGESHGYETNMPRPNAWPYRDYVVEALNQDLPYSQFVFDQLAGDVSKGREGLPRAATGFLVAGTHDEVGNATREGMLQQRMDDLDDMIAAASSTFLGLSIQCARCHDHKFDPISQKDYYAFQAVFAGVQHGEREIPLAPEPARLAERKSVGEELARIEGLLDGFEPLAHPEADQVLRRPVDPLRNVERFEPALARSIRILIEATSDGAEPCIDELEVYPAGADFANRALASEGASPSASSEYPNNPIHKIAHLNDGRFNNDRSWISNQPGKGWARIDFVEPVLVDHVVWGRDRSGQYRDRLATSYKIEVALEPEQWTVVASSADRAPYSPGSTSEGIDQGLSKERKPLEAYRDRLRVRFAELSREQKIFAGIFSQPAETHLLERGDPTRPGEAIAPGTPASIAPRVGLEPSAPESKRRAALAQWISDQRNPLSARVLVNRIWQYHFGKGIVATPSDFGLQGSPPTHPELLDWLASEFQSNGGRIKPIHRLIMLSQAYRQQNGIRREGLEVDAGDDWLWRNPSRRLDAETIRDSMLFASGELDLTIGGPSYSIWEKNTNYVAVYTPVKELGPESFRRMIYQFRPRGRLDATFGVFDCPDASQVVSRRPISTTSAQALALWNSEFVLGRAKALALRAERESGGEADRAVDRMFAITLGRKPSRRERNAALRSVSKGEAEAIARALFNSNEFIISP